MKKEISLKQLYVESFQFIKKTRKTIFICLGIFILMALVGFFISPPKEIELQIMEQLRQIGARFQGLSCSETIWAIFSNNVYVSFLSVITGIAFGIVPVFIAMSNGYVIGFVANKVVTKEGLLVLLKLLPHGIFEIPAIMISIGLGIRLGQIWKNKESAKTTWKKITLAFILIVVPLLIIAAIIEGLLIFYLS
jgi:stage II sporulation protein M